MKRMYELLLDLPLFRGVSYNKISEILEIAKFDIRKYTDNQIIVGVGEPCDMIIFVISGKVRMETVGNDNQFSLYQTLEAPDVIDPNNLFGAKTLWSSTVKSINDTGIIALSKNDYIKILHSDQVFLFNFLNLLSQNSQKAIEGFKILPSSFERCIALWFNVMTQSKAKDIKLEIRGDFSLTQYRENLEELRRRGIVNYGSDYIELIDRKRLVECLNK